VPLFVAGLPIFSRAYYSTKNFEETTLDPPLGSGPYKVGRFESGRYIEYDRVKDWWGAALPIARGQNNFDVVRFEFYRDRDVAFEGFTAKSYLFREEFTARTWATRYDFPGGQGWRVKLRMLDDDTPVRRAGLVHEHCGATSSRISACAKRIIQAFDFEWTNQNIMYGAYKRTFSVFQNSNMTAEGKPARGTGAARAVPRQGAGRRVRRAVHAAGLGRLRTGPRAVAQGLAIAAAGRPRHQGRQAGGRQGRAADIRVPDRRADLPAAPHAVHQEPRRARHRGDPCASSIRFSSASASTSSTSTSRCSASASPRRRETRCAPISRPRRENERLV
jgi:hypothetical protein